MKYHMDTYIALAKMINMNELFSSHHRENFACQIKVVLLSRNEIEQYKMHARFLYDIVLHFPTDELEK